jgi:2,3,4,5-tetrahydropyridine-2-carboxylate N-succinyltransferase
MLKATLFYQETIEAIWNDLASYPKDEAKKIVHQVISLLDSGKLRVAEKLDGEYVTHTWLKLAILLFFKLQRNKKTHAGEICWYDKVDIKFDQSFDWQIAKIRAIPGAFARFGSYISENVILMPSFVNIGAHIGSGTMIDTWSTIGSCAQIGKNCHISGGVGIGGVLEPVSANPVIIEDNCFIGARSEIAEGVIVGEGSVISMGVYIGASTKIVDRTTGEVTYGSIPPYSVVVPGSMPAKDSYLPSLYCAVIVKKVDENTRKKTSINELLRS